MRVLIIFLKVILICSFPNDVIGKIYTLLRREQKGMDHLFFLDLQNCSGERMKRISLIPTEFIKHPKGLFYSCDIPP